MKLIPRPTLKSATVLRAPDLNRLHFSGLHSVITPRRIIDDTCPPTKNPK